MIFSTIYYYYSRALWAKQRLNMATSFGCLWLRNLFENCLWMFTIWSCLFNKGIETFLIPKKIQFVKVVLSNLWFECHKCSWSTWGNPIGKGFYSFWFRVITRYDCAIITQRHPTWGLERRQQHLQWDIYFSLWDMT